MARGRHAAHVAALTATLIGLAGVPSRAATIVVDTLDDVADPPFAAADLCGSGTVDELPGADAHTALREALGAANHTPGPHRITFAPELRGGTLRVGFDGPDADAGPDPLPFLCGGGVTLDGDIDADGAPDITLQGQAALPAFAGGLTVLSSNNTITGMSLHSFPASGIIVFHPFFHSNAPAAENNALLHNVVRGGTFAFVVEAGSDRNSGIGTVRNTTVRGNTASEAMNDGILVITGDAAGSSITGTTVADNQVADNGRFGILITTHLGATGSETRLENTLVRNNMVTGNGATGIAAFSFAGRQSAISGLVIEGNDLDANGFAISSAGGVCGASANVMEVTIADNVLRSSGILVNGGTNLQCGSAPLRSASSNMLTATIARNRLADGMSTGISVVGGTVNATRNSVAATLAENDVTGLAAITIIGGSGISGDDVGAADHNTVAAMVRDNRVGPSFAGIGITGGASGDANDNVVAVVAEHNIACGSVLADIQCEGGFLGALGVPPTRGTRNRVTGRIASNLATKVVVRDGVPGNTCSAEPRDNASCRAGDASCNGRVTAADLTRLIVVIAEDTRAVCRLDDTNLDMMVDASDVPATVTAIFTL